MEIEIWSQDPVDPEVRAYVSSLVSALGGTGTDEYGRYVLGDDALACLKDLKKWLKLHDEKANRLDVARCLAEANIVSGDLLEILAGWPEEATNDRIRSKVVLACLELLVPLTWPIEKNDAQMTVNHHRHAPYLQIAQTKYKRAIIGHESGKVLRNTVRIGLPSMALQLGERGNRDEGIIKLLLYFFRNVAMINSPQNLPDEGNGDDISRSATIEAFHQQDVLALILTISSNMGEDFNTQDTVIMEILFHLFKGIDAGKLFMDKTQRADRNTDELQSLLSAEAGMHRSYKKNAPSRHNRFGTMIWVKRDDARLSTVSGQDGLMSKERTLSKMDESKKWNKPRTRNKDIELGYNRFDLPVPLSETACAYLRTFVEEFLDSSFNPLFSHIRKAIEREAERVMDFHAQQFFYLISWFLEAERFRRKKKRDVGARNKSLETLEEYSFALVASVLNQETFISLNRFMQDRLDLKLWNELNAGMRCFTKILLIVQDMSESQLEEDQEIAENIQNRIFYEETTHDRVVTILRGYKDQGFGYLDSCTELSHVFLRMLERYSKENVELQVRSRRRARKRKKAPAKPNEENEYMNGGEDSQAEDEAEAERASKERKFDFSRFASKFVAQACINTFVSFVRYYKELDTEQLKRGHRFFYRVAFKEEQSVLLYRLDIISLFHKMIKGPDGLDSAGPLFREWEELVRQLFKGLTKKLQRTPALAVELLFSKISSMVFFLENGYDKQAIQAKPRLPAVLQVKGALSKDEEIGVAVAVLHDMKIDAVDWVLKVLASAASERQSCEAAVAAKRLEEGPDTEGLEGSENPESIPKMSMIVVNPDNEERRVAMFKDKKLRLLMTLAGFERLGVEDEPSVTWIIPSTIAARELHETHEMIEKHRNNPVTEYGEEGDKKTAEDMLRRASTEKKRRVEYDDDSGSDDGFISEGDEDFLYAPGGPTPMEKRADALDQLRRKRRRYKNKGDEDILTDDEARQAKRKAKLTAEKEKMRRMKSKLIIGDSDEESNEEEDRAFFAGEEALRRAQAEKAMEALNAGELNGITSTLQVKESKKRKSGADGDLEGGGRRKKKKEQMNADSVEDDGYANPASSSSPETRQANNLAALDLDSDNDNDDDMNDFALEKRKSRKKPAVAIDVDSETTNDDVDALLPSSKRQRAVNIAEDDETEGEAAAPNPGRSRRPPAKVNSLAAPYSDDDDDMNDHSLERRSKTTKPATTHDANSDSSAILLASLSPTPNINPHSSLPILHIDSEENEVLEPAPPSSSLQLQQRKLSNKSTVVSNLDDSDNDMKDFYPSSHLRQTPKHQQQQRKKSPNFPATTTTGDIGSSEQQQRQRPRRRRDHHRRRRGSDSDSQVSVVLSKQGEEGTSNSIITATTVNDADPYEDDEMDVPPPPTAIATGRRRRRGKVAELSSESE